MKNKISYIIIFLVGLWLLTSVFANFFSAVSGNVALIPVKGIIITEGDNYQMSTTSEEILRWIDHAEENPNIKAIVFEINSPGGGALAGKEIATRIEKIEKPTVAVIRDMGASAGYLIAASTDHIIADELSLTGSIAAVASYLEFSGFLEKYNITYERLVSAEYKDMGNPLKKLSDKERQMLKSQLDLVHAYFVNTVAENRNLSIEFLNSLGGSFFLGMQAKEYGLIDSFGNVDSAKKYLEDNLNTTIEFHTYSRKKHFFNLISNSLNDFSVNLGRGFALGLMSENELRIN